MEKRAVTVVENKPEFYYGYIIVTLLIGSIGFGFASNITVAVAIVR